MCKQNLLFSFLPIRAFFTNDQIIVFENVSEKGTLLIIESGDVCFTYGFSEALARDYCCAGINIKCGIHHSRLDFPYPIYYFKS